MKKHSKKANEKGRMSANQGQPEVTIGIDGRAAEEVKKRVPLALECKHGSSQPSFYACYLFMLF